MIEDREWEKRHKESDNRVGLRSGILRDEEGKRRPERRRRR